MARGVVVVDSLSEVVFPLTVSFADGDELTVDSIEDAETTLEWFDSDDPKEGIIVRDQLGRRVSLRIEALRLIRCSLF